MQDTKKQLKALVLTKDNEEKIKFEYLKLSESNFKVVASVYDDFQEGNKENRFDVVVAPIFSEDCSADDIEMMEEFYQHYSNAPVFTWVVFKGDEFQEIKKFLTNLVPQSNIVEFSENSEDAQAEAVLKAFKLCEESY